MSAQRCQLSTSSDHTSLRIVLFWTLSLRPTLSDIPTLLLIIELYRRMTQRSSSTYLSFSHWRSYYSVFPTTTWRCPSTLQMCVCERVCARACVCATSHGKIPRNTPAMAGNWARAIKGTNSEIHSFSHWPITTQSRREQRLTCIHSPTELSWPRLRRGQTVRYIHSPTELSWPGPWRGQTVRYIHSPTDLSSRVYALLIDGRFTENIQGNSSANGIVNCSIDTNTNVRPLAVPLTGMYG